MSLSGRPTWLRWRGRRVHEADRQEEPGPRVDVAGGLRSGRQRGLRDALRLDEIGDIMSEMTAYGTTVTAEPYPPELAGGSWCPGLQ